MRGHGRACARSVVKSKKNQKMWKKKWMGIKSNLFLFKIKFILCEIACFLCYLTGIFAVLLFVGCRRCLASTSNVRAHFSSSRTYTSLVHFCIFVVWMRLVRHRSFLFAPKRTNSSLYLAPLPLFLSACLHWNWLFLQATTTRTTTTMRIQKAQCECMIRGNSRTTVHMLLFSIYCVRNAVNRSERINTYIESIYLASEEIGEIERMRTNKQKEIATAEWKKKIKKNPQKANGIGKWNLSHKVECDSSRGMALGALSPNKWCRCGSGVGVGCCRADPKPFF